MDRSFENYLYFGGELFIPIQEAFDYLVDGSVVYQLDQFFFHYKGFADECEFGEGYLDPFCTLLRIVYLDAVAILDDMEGVLHKFKQMSFDGGSLTARWFDPYRGTINGKNELPENCQISYYFRTDITMNNSNVYVRQSDLMPLLGMPYPQESQRPLDIQGPVGLSLTSRVARLVVPLLRQPTRLRSLTWRVLQCDERVRLVANECQSGEHCS